MADNTLNPTVYDNWTDFVVIVNKKNWIEILLKLYSSIDGSRLPHFRFSLSKKNYGVAIRFLAIENSDVVSKLTKFSASLNTQSSVNPKKQRNDPLSGLSGWFDGPESFNMTQERANLFHALSESAILALKTGFSNSQMRKQVVHQFCNMMALVDPHYLSLFKIKED